MYPHFGFFVPGSGLHAKTQHSHIQLAILICDDSTFLEARPRGVVIQGKKEPKPKLFGPDIFGWGGGLPREGVGAKKFVMSFETQGNQTLWRDIPGFLPGYPKGARKV